LKNKNSRIFVIVFFVLMLSALVWSITQNWSRRAETESAAAAAQAGQKFSAQNAVNKKTGIIMQSSQTLKFEPLDVATSNGVTRLNVEIMRTPEDLARGLMFRQSMLDDQGMLFDFGLDRPIAMWMQNTYLSLDMVFVTSDGKIHRIEENTEPLSEKNISSGINVRFVLELKAGTVRRLGIKAGDRLIHSVFLNK
jgi:uncharacterized protein